MSTKEELLSGLDVISGELDIVMAEDLSSQDKLKKYCEMLTKHWDTIEKVIKWIEELVPDYGKKIANVLRILLKVAKLGCDIVT